MRDINFKQIIPYTVFLGGLVFLFALANTFEQRRVRDDHVETPVVFSAPHEEKGVKTVEYGRGMFPNEEQLSNAEPRTYVASERNVSALDAHSTLTEDDKKLSILENIVCPFSEKEYRTIIDFTEQGTISIDDLAIRADVGIQEATYPKKDILLEPGTYMVQLASYKVPQESALTEYYEESWFVKLFNASGKELFRSRPTRDMQKDETETIELVDSAGSLKETIHGILAQHSAYPDDKAQEVIPVCVAFDVLQNASTETQDTVQKEVLSNSDAVTTKTTVVVPSTTLEEGIDSSVLSAQEINSTETFPLHTVSKQEVVQVNDVTATVYRATTAPAQAQEALVYNASQGKSQKSVAIVYILALFLALFTSAWFGTSQDLKK